MQLAVRAFIDAPHPGAWMARSESDELPTKSLLASAYELEDEGERALRWRSVAGRQVELGATGELGLVWTESFAGPKCGERETVLLEMLAGHGSNGTWPTGKAANRLAPDCFVEADLNPALGCG